MNTQKRTAKDVMKSNVVTVRRDEHIQNLARLLEDNGISGVPVVNENNHLVGVVSKSDIVHWKRMGNGAGIGDTYYADRAEILPSGYHVYAPDTAKVEEIMTPTIISVKGSTPIGIVARLMRRRHIHRVLITERKKVKGIVTTMDLLRILEDSPGSSGTRSQMRAKRNPHRTA